VVAEVAAVGVAVPVVGEVGGKDPGEWVVHKQLDPEDIVSVQNAVTKSGM